MSLRDIVIRNDSPEGFLPGGHSSLTPEESDLLARLRDGITLAEAARAGSAPWDDFRNAVDDIFSLDDLGLIRLRWPTSSPLLRQFYDDPAAAPALCADHPGLWNVFAYEREWITYPEFNDFLYPESPVFHTKRFETDVYLELLRPFLDPLSPGRVLDLAGGIGRFSVELLSRGHEVHLADACAASLKCAWRRLSPVSPNFHLHLADMENLSLFPDNHFDAVLALEALCYATHPEKALDQILRVARPGALIALSVENHYGALIADPNLFSDNVFELLRSPRLLVPEYVCTTYYTRRAFTELLASAGLTPELLEGCLFTASGVLNRLVDEKSLADTTFRDAMFELERTSRLDPVLRDLPRAWLAVVRKPSA